MEEIEAPTENLEETIHHHATHSNESWVSDVALGSALLAVLAAISSLLSNHHSDEAVIDQIKASNQWAYYQAKGVKAIVLQSKIDTLKALNKPAADAEAQKVEKYKEEQKEISEQAAIKEENSETHLKHHSLLSRAVTLFQIAIAISAISVLTKRKKFWHVGIAFGAAGLLFLIFGII
jgi:hypothetical protein